MPQLTGISAGTRRVATVGKRSGRLPQQQARPLRGTIMDCHRVRESMFQATDNELEAELLAPFRDHLSSCSDCAHAYVYVGKLVATIRGRCSRYGAPSHLKIRILTSFPHRGGVLQE